jgi:dolichol-phosphate mannosyltransferase
VGLWGKIETLSVAAPAYNEAEGIEALVRGWLAYMQSKPLSSFEIVVCNDGSRDDTGTILARLAAAHDQVRFVTHAVNRGGGVAMASAIAATRKRWVLTLDADGQFPIENLERFAEALAESDARAFLGARAKKRDSVGARFGSTASTLVLNGVYGTRYHDFTSACQLVEGDLLRSLTLEARGLNYSLEVVARLLERGIEPVEVPIRHLPRSGGRTSRTLVRSGLERAGFVSYLGLRRVLVGQRVLRDV